MIRSHKLRPAAQRSATGLAWLLPLSQPEQHVGQVGTVVELLDGAYEVEFSDDEGKTYAELALQSDQLLILHHRPLRAA